MKSPVQLSRRRILQSLTAITGLTVAGAGTTLWALRGRAPAVAGLSILSGQQYRTLAALARALFPPGGAFPAGADEVRIAQAFDTFLADEPVWNQRDIKQALLLLEYGPVFFDRRLKTFSHLSEPERLRHFESWAESGSVLRRQASVAFRKFFNLVFYDQPACWPGIGYRGPLVGGFK